MGNEETLGRAASSSKPLEHEKLYTLKRSLGVGAFSTVHLATHTCGARVALKRIDKAALTSPDELHRAGCEIRLLKQLCHPFIVRLHHTFATSGSLCLVLEYAPHGELFDYIVARGRLDDATACRFFQQALSGLRHLHEEMHWAHRDIKPENLLLDKDLKIRIADFGLSSPCAPGGMVGPACGSPCYAAPEMLTRAGRDAYEGHPADFWALGVVLYAMLEGQLPFEDNGTAGLYDRIISGRYRTPTRASASGKSMVRFMLKTSPRERPRALDLLDHPWCRSCHAEPVAADSLFRLRRGEPNAEMLERIEAEFGYESAQLREELLKDARTAATACFWLINNSGEQPRERESAHAIQFPTTASVTALVEPAAQKKPPLTPRRDEGGMTNVRSRRFGV